MSEIKIFSIGKIINDEKNVCCKLESDYTAGLKGLKEYSHVQILWWMDGCDNDRDRNTLVEKQPYNKGPERLGVFALRSPERPNPIGASVAEIAYVDESNGIAGLHYIDAFSGSDILDIKPYVPGIDRVEKPCTPEWCRHWPKSYEESGSFDWQDEFNF